ncbi:hypothetical protein BJX65DRAFT_44436 [Aspergillus insuetus]
MPLSGLRTTRTHSGCFSTYPVLYLGASLVQRKKAKASHWVLGQALNSAGSTANPNKWQSRLSALASSTHGPLLFPRARHPQLPSPSCLHILTLFTNRRAYFAQFHQGRWQIIKTSRSIPYAESLPAPTHKQPTAPKAKPLRESLYQSSGRPLADTADH